MTKLGFETEAHFHFELDPAKKRKVSVEAAAHVSGAAQYFHPSQLPGQVRRKYFLKKTVSPVETKVTRIGFTVWTSHHFNFTQFSQKLEKKGVALHPVYGSWFAIRAVLILLGLEDEDLIRPEPLNLIEVRGAVNK